MRTSVIPIAVFIGISFTSIRAISAGLVDFETTCAEIGFKKRTPAFGECVLELDNRSKREKEIKSELSRVSPVREAASQVDNSPDHKVCLQFGFIAGKREYADCRLKLDIARQEQSQRQLIFEAEQRKFEADQNRYEAEVREFERQKDIQKNMALLKFGLALMGGASPIATENFANAARSSVGIEPIPPVKPQIQNFTITNSTGRVVNCTVVSNSVNCF